MLALSLEDRFIYDSGRNMFFVNFEGYMVKSGEDVQQMKELVEGILSPLPQKVYTIANYDNFSISLDVMDEYTRLVESLTARFYSGVTRYTTSTFLRMKMGDALTDRQLRAHISESPGEARRVSRRSG